MRRMKKNDPKDQLLDHHIHVLQFLKPEHLDVSESRNQNYYLSVEYTNHPDFEVAVCQLRSMMFCISPKLQLLCLADTTKTLFQILGEQNSSADDFLPLFIYCTIRTNFSHFGIITEYINDYRNPKELVMG